MIRPPVLGEVVGSNLLRPHAPADDASVACNCAHFFFFGLFPKLSPKKVESYISVGLLKASPLGGDHDPGRLVG